MIEITDIDGRSMFLSPLAIASVTEAGAPSQWHDIRSFVRTFDGRVIECRTEARELARSIAASQTKGE
ncbi:hypothetical protein [Pandoraea sp. ISTKB]|uniref:hypothetical protein n=1 Tax=Pandoraea sp. ISTKB TaxID=1586708 RepID=UPI000846FCEC|nr:hypothetical protein [Pandoraea sp. ISTKB]ODP33098.1 hypothetical protein A9762_20870 [Pandoraea sp. ISTKB]